MEVPKKKTEAAERRFLRRGSGHGYDPRKAVLEEKNRQRWMQTEELKMEQTEDDVFLPSNLGPGSSKANEEYVGTATKGCTSSRNNSVESSSGSRL